MFSLHTIRAVTAAPVFAVTISVAGVLTVLNGSAYAQGGQTEVSKTLAPPASITPPAPVAAPAPAPVAIEPAQTANPAQAAATPAGNWQPNVATKEAAASTAGPVSDLQAVEVVNAYFNKLTTMQGTFVQTDPDNKQKRGKFYFERPGKVRFDYGSPSKLKLISDGQYLAIEDHDLQTSDRYPLEMTPFRLLLSPKVDLAHDAKILGIDQSADTVILTLEDKKNDNGGRIRLFFAKPALGLKEWIVTDAQGLDTRIELAGVELNRQVPASLFEFSKNIGFKNMNQ